MKKDVTKQKPSFLESYFHLEENNSNVKTEILAGITTFVTMAYIIFVNPNILKIAGMNSANAVGDAAAQFSVGSDPIVSSVFVATCLAAAIGTLIMGLYANLPFAQAPGMGLNAFFTYTVCLTLGFTWHQALSCVFMSGVLFILITVTSIREKIVDAIPQNLKYAISGGIGLYIALIGLKSGGVVVSNPATLVGFGNFANPGTLLTIIGIIITAVLMARGIKGSILIGIISTTIIGIPFKITSLENLHVFSAPPSLAPTFAAFDFAGLFSKGGTSIGGAFLSVIMVVITICLVDLFDTIGTLVGTATKAGMVDENGKVLRMKKALICDAVATTAGSVLGTSTISTYIESTAGVSEGGRTGLTSTVVGILFILSLFFSGLVGIVPGQATAPALVIVGVLMMSAIVNIDFSDFTEAVPAFFAISLMAFSYSIANGIAVAMIFYPITKIATGRQKEIHPIVYILAVLFILRYILLPFE
ncbi:xanthine/uracil permease [Clostridium beijerinckii]|jgi:AGZA family xanthine/uracil permease-like MFS transporter|uniref:NCS2 family permease n=1 Tax=Clostridium beijerinckii TaxID=1520 RepID=A0AB74VLD6_CLOBE|nr:MULTISPECIES: NCS2 family permease [Clostridium]AVK50935.1 guanine permease [Clostridium sp. MF28]MCI1580519.1 NCS2 family permease [Clostridium beijerinckii]MCI1583939.1 NCS2 family permease [Clostridium beijerinckii]MCI1624318.1 NCS2 family permease [Clostridium beijerinckii]NRT76461.1 AGZA family xanthine/uracil permease-like MFS transporter [Clostridium beijerinckii]